MIHLYCGENDFAIKRAVDAVCASFATKHGENSVAKINGGEIDADKLIAEIVNINMFAPQRLIVVENLAKNKTAWVKLGENLLRIPDETEVLIVESTPDKRTKTFKELKKIAKIKEFPTLRFRDLDEWTMNEAHSQNVEIKRDAVDELIMATSGNQWQIAVEIAKFSTLDQMVDKKLVARLVEPNLEASAFAVLDFAMNGRRDVMIRELANLRKLEDANKFLGLLSSQIFALSTAVNAGDRRSNDVAKEMGIHPFVMEKMFAAARKLDKRDLAKYAQIVAETDAKCKLSNAADAWILVELALAKIVR